MRWKRCVLHVHWPLLFVALLGRGVARPEFRDEPRVIHTGACLAADDGVFAEYVDLIGFRFTIFLLHFHLVGIALAGLLRGLSSRRRGGTSRRGISGALCFVATLRFHPVMIVLAGLCRGLSGSHLGGTRRLCFISGVGGFSCRHLVPRAGKRAPVIPYFFSSLRSCGATLDLVAAGDQASLRRLPLFEGRYFIVESCYPASLRRMLLFFEGRYFMVESCYPASLRRMLLFE